MISSVFAALVRTGSAAIPATPISAALLVSISLSFPVFVLFEAMLCRRAARNVDEAQTSAWIAGTRRDPAHGQLQWGQRIRPAARIDPVAENERADVAVQWAAKALEVGESYRAFARIIGLQTVNFFEFASRFFYTC
ncbi:hypothetical protein [Pseudooceanicola antarcticus]|uniref:hypothetical protein n=1 Tax=Pseudooceanicola antarcticus TaxID=1247613 RepID=UPI0015CD3A7C|nr:hypothetical protein [Pseudooceanicola antarcticus]